MRKKLLSSALVSKGVSFAIAWYMRLTYWTSRWDVRGRENLPTGGAIYVFWHGRILMMPCVWKKPASMHVLVSPHRDGTISNGVLKNLGFSTIRGTSSNASSLNALRHILRVLKSGNNIAITPDGPRGPREQIHSRVIDIAKNTGAQIVPMSFSSTRYRFLSSWDRFLFALPFGKGMIIYDRPLQVPADISETEVRAYEKLLVDRLNLITLEADLYTGIKSKQEATHD